MITTIETSDDGAGNPTTESWSDVHDIVWDSSREPMVVVSDTVVPVPESDSPDARDAAGDDSAPDVVAADPSSSTRPFPTRTPVSPASPAPGGHGTGLAAGFPVQNRVIPHAFVGYALKWTAAPHNDNNRDSFNPKYPYFNNNCANFASQVLDNSGWYLTGGNSLQVKDLTKWTFNLAGLAGATRTWSRARDLYTFANNTGYFEWLDNIWNARPGDLLFVDWDPHGAADGHIDHVMVVTGVTKAGVPRISQKSNSRYNLKLGTVLALARQQKKTSLVWYGLKHR